MNFCSSVKHFLFLCAALCIFSVQPLSASKRALEERDTLPEPSSKRPNIIQHPNVFPADVWCEIASYLPLHQYASLRVVSTFFLEALQGQRALAKLNWDGVGPKRDKDKQRIHGVNKLFPQMSLHLIFSYTLDDDEKGQVEFNDQDFTTTDDVKKLIDGISKDTSVYIEYKYFEYYASGHHTNIKIKELHPYLLSKENIVSIIFDDLHVWEESSIEQLSEPKAYAHAVTLDARGFNHDTLVTSDKADALFKAIANIHSHPQLDIKWLLSHDNTIFMDSLLKALPKICCPYVFFELYQGAASQEQTAYIKKIQLRFVEALEQASIPNIWISNSSYGLNVFDTDACASILRGLSYKKGLQKLSFVETCIGQKGGETWKESVRAFFKGREELKCYFSLSFKQCSFEGNKSVVLLKEAAKSSYLHFFEWEENQCGVTIDLSGKLLAVWEKMERNVVKELNELKEMRGE
jgi:hypothetical protein